jgi:hypothetical protein
VTSLLGCHYVAHPLHSNMLQMRRRLMLKPLCLQCKTEAELVAAIKTATSDKIDK